MPSVGDEADGYVVEGYATTFDEPYDLGYGGVREVVRSDAFSETDMGDVIFQYNHDGMVLARMRNGTLTIENDAHGMKVRADLGGSDQGRSLYESIKNGLVDRMSWGFLIADDGWEFDKESRTATITKVSKVFDVSAVSIPANEGTEIKARSYLDAVRESEQQEMLKIDEREERMRMAAALELTKGM